MQDHDIRYVRGFRHLADLTANICILIVQKVAFVEPAYAIENGAPEQHEAACWIRNWSYNV